MNKKIDIDDVHYHNINEFPKNFDVKDVSEDLNCCDKCEVIVRWYDEMYWKGEEDMETNKILGEDYEAVCDDCFNILSNQKI